jgi:hypothetical protein
MPAKLKLEGRLNRLASISIAQLRWWGKDLKEIVRKRGLGDDLLQALYLAAVEGLVDGLDPDCPEDIKEMRRRAHRAIYHCLVDYGFRRPRGSKVYVWTDMPYSYLGGTKKGINPNPKEW